MRLDEMVPIDPRGRVVTMSEPAEWLGRCSTPVEHVPEISRVRDVDTILMSWGRTPDADRVPIGLPDGCHIVIQLSRVDRALAEECARSLVHRGCAVVDLILCAERDSVAPVLVARAGRTPIAPRPWLTSSVLDPEVPVDADLGMRMALAEHVVARSVGSLAESAASHRAMDGQRIAERESQLLSSELARHRDAFRRLASAADAGGADIGSASDALDYDVIAHRLEVLREQLDRMSDERDEARRVAARASRRRRDAQDQARALTASTTYQLGDLLVQAVRRPRSILSMPGRLRGLVRSRGR